MSKRRRNILLGIGAFIVLVAAGVAIYVWTQINKPLPTINGSASLPGLTANVTVTRDTNGVPHIVAGNLQDLYMAQGYVHAQDRLYQMFFFRTAGQGRLSELFSPSLVDSDRYLRTLGFARTAQTEYDQLRPDVKQALQWYADGVNAFVHSHTDSLPLEFSLLGIGFEDWKPVDTLIFGKMEGRDLTESWINELVKADIVKAVGSDIAAELLPGYPADGPAIVPGTGSGSYQQVIAQYNTFIAPLLAGWDDGIGSNNWVVDGTKSTTGKPLLANDPHLGVRNPSIWYQIHLTTTDGKYDDDGFGFAGVPGIITGHNQNISWGVTNVEADVEDIYLEQADDPAHPGQYLTADGWKPLQIITETIKVHGADPVTQTVRVTDHGPILSDAFPITPTLSTAITGTYSVQWTLLQPTHLFEAVFDLQTAQNWTDFRKALSEWDVPGQNFVYADTQGNIGYQTTGQLPIRKKGDGSVPVPGWTGDYGWTGFIPFDDLPSTYNPPDHFVATANNIPFSSNYKYTVPGYYAKPWRIDRILELLKGKDKLGVSDFEAMQMDTTSLLAKQVLPMLTALKPADDQGTQAVNMLKGWDGNVTADSAAAAIYEITYHQILTRTFSDELGRTFSADTSNLFAQYLDSFKGEALLSVANLLDKPNDPLWDDKSTPQVETRDDILLTSLSAALGELSTVIGSDMTTWTWGQVHLIQPSHEFSQQPLIGGLFTLDAKPIGGDNTTVSVGGYDLPVAAFPLQAFAVSSHQSYRMIIDLSDWTKSEAIFATGESGQPGSKYRDNMYAPWLSYQYFPMLWTKEQIATDPAGVLTLTP
jgi:penicillin amidase